MHSVSSPAVSDLHPALGSPLAWGVESDVASISWDSQASREDIQ